MGNIVEVPGPKGGFIKGHYFEYEGVWYFKTGVYNAWAHFSPPDHKNEDPPIIKPEMRAWLVERGICLRAWEERANLQLVFKDPDTFMLFRLTWL